VATRYVSLEHICTYNEGAFVKIRRLIGSDLVFNYVQPLLVAKINFFYFKQIILEYLQHLFGYTMKFHHPRFGRRCKRGFWQKNSDDYLNLKSVTQRQKRIPNQTLKRTLSKIDKKILYKLIQEQCFLFYLYVRNSIYTL